MHALSEMSWGAIYQYAGASESVNKDTNTWLVWEESTEHNFENVNLKSRENWPSPSPRFLQRQLCDIMQKS